MQLTFYVFSYNRGLFLKNCVESIHRCAPGNDIIIIDDGSNDPDTLAILDSLASECRIISQPKDKITKLGGLYHNMQIALDDFAPNGLFVFIQDDCQMVRKLQKEDEVYIQNYFEHFPEAAFLNPHFLKGNRKSGILRAIYEHREFPAYFYDFSEKLKDRSVTMYYTDICIGHAQFWLICSRR